MSSQDFASNNNNPANSLSGRGHRARVVTADERVAQNQARRENRSQRGSVVSSATAPGHTMPTVPQQIVQNLATGVHPVHSHISTSTPLQNQHYGPTTFLQPEGSPTNPFHSNLGHDANAAHNWLFAQLNADPQLLAQLQGIVGPPPAHFEDQDEEFADPQADMPDDSDGGAPPFSSGGGDFANTMPTLPTGVPQTTNTFETPTNLRAFPSATANMSSTHVENNQRRPLIRRAANPTYSDLSSPSTQMPDSESSSPIVAHTRQPLIHRTNIFGPGLHDNRHRPRHSMSSEQQPTQKENAVHRLSDDESMEPAPPKKKSRKQPAARSISSIAPDRVPIIEKAYEYIGIKVTSDADHTWLQARTDLADFVQEAFDWAVEQLRLNPDEFDPVTAAEQDLCRERIYGARKDFKDCARLAVKGADGFGFISCSARATEEEQDRIATANRKLVAALTDKSAFVFANPHDRTIKGSMYQHPCIAVVIRGVLYANLLSMGMQFPQYFDDTFPDTPDESQNHKPTLSLVTIALAITAIRAAIMEYSSGHFLGETFSRKVYKPHFDAELSTLRDWRQFTSNPTTIPGGGPARFAPASFLTRGFQEKLISEARDLLLKDVIAPVPPPEVMDLSDFAANQ
ncbi:hypothetical protein R3P38DRAFT_3445288 [Favolaschia claudopus]|uniref:DUF6532 domain-containing protein n=1 Tax=Favolaschia claudopus TaxID=2862362 RepID=A0AAV9ZPA3_9AGAR